MDRATPDTSSAAAATAIQAKPVGWGAEITPLVIADLQARSDAGKVKYGERLRALNGRDALIDLYQELLDGAQYIRQAIEERGLRPATPPQAPAPAAPLGAVEALNVCHALDEFQARYQSQTRDQAPGNDYWGPQLLTIVAAARAALAAVPMDPAPQGLPSGITPADLAAIARIENMDQSTPQAAGIRDIFAQIYTLTQAKKRPWEERMLEISGLAGVAWNGIPPASPVVPPVVETCDLGRAWNLLADAMHVLDGLAGSTPRDSARMLNVHAMIEEAHGIVQKTLALSTPVPAGREWWIVKWPSGSMEVRGARPTSGHARFQAENIHVREVTPVPAPKEGDQP